MLYEVITDSDSCIIAGLPPILVGCNGHSRMTTSHADRRVSLENKRLRDGMVRMRSAMVCSLTALVDLKDFETGVHSTRLAEWAVRVGKQLGP